MSRAGKAHFTFSPDSLLECVNQNLGVAGSSNGCAGIYLVIIDQVFAAKMNSVFFSCRFKVLEIENLRAFRLSPKTVFQNPSHLRR
jgi:hypothetical protein